MTATQAPTPGPLSGDDDLLPCPFCEGDVIVTDSQECQDAETYYWHRCAGCGVESEGTHGASAARDQWNMRPQPFCLAPTAPVEASVSEREAVGRLQLFANGLSVSTIWSSDKFDHQTPFELIRNDLKTVLAVLHPQPSGETRPTDEELRSAIKATEYKYFGDYEFSEEQHAAVDVLVRAAQALLSARPLALGGQQGETLTLLTELLDGPSQGTFHGINDALRAKLETIRQTLRSTTPARAEAQDEGAAGEASAYRVRMISKDPAEWVLMHPEKALDFLSRKGWESQPLYAHPSPTPAADAIQKIEADRDAWKLRGDNHWETLRSIREFAREGDCERIIKWVNDAGSGYTQSAEQTLGQMTDRALKAEASLASTPAADADRVRIAVEALPNGTYQKSETVTATAEGEETFAELRQSVAEALPELFRCAGGTDRIRKGDPVPGSKDRTYDYDRQAHVAFVAHHPREALAALKSEGK